jgi:hypothetical protein
VTERRSCAPAQTEHKHGVAYFHHSNGRTNLDRFGTDLPDAPSVRTEAVRALREILHLHGKIGDDLFTAEPWKIWVTKDPDGTGPTVLSLEVSAHTP